MTHLLQFTVNVNINPTANFYELVKLLGEDHVFLN
jgi:hypothetical protein